MAATASSLSYPSCLSILAAASCIFRHACANTPGSRLLSTTALVQRHVAAVGRIRCAFDHLWPGENHLALSPGLSGQGAPLLLHQTGPHMSLADCDESIRIDQDLPKTRITIRSLVAEQEQAGLGCDRDPHLVGDALSLAADERLLADEDLDMALESELQFGRQTRHERHTATQDSSPCRWERLGPKHRAPALRQPRLPEQGGDCQG